MALGSGQGMGHSPEPTGQGRRSTTHIPGHSKGPSRLDKAAKNGKISPINIKHFRELPVQYFNWQYNYAKTL